MKTASWILLVIAAGLTLLGGLVSLGVAYGSTQDQIGPASLADLSVGRPEVATAVRARRATASCCADDVCIDNAIHGGQRGSEAGASSVAMRRCSSASRPSHSHSA